MRIGVPKEIKTEEYRVGITPSGVRELVELGHEVVVETGSGEGSGFSDEEFRSAGARIAGRGDVFSKADLIVKVKEPLPSEFDLIRPGLLLFTYLHLAPNPDLVRVLMEKRVAAIAYETVEEKGGLPLLAPMSEIAGRMAPLVGAWFLQKPQRGSGVLPTGVPGVKPARALIIGAGTAGSNAARVAVGLGMEVTVINKGMERLRTLDLEFGGRIKTLPSTLDALEEEAIQSDLVIGAVLVTGARAPRLITRNLVARMKPGAVIVDISVDQGGCAETTRPTTHADPVYTVDGVIHYAVANMPGAFPRTSTLALTNATLPYVKAIAGHGAAGLTQTNSPLASGLNIFEGRVIHPALRELYG